MATAAAVDATGTIPTTTVATATAATVATATGVTAATATSTMLHWSGNVDDELEIRIQNGRVTYRTLSGAQPTSVRVDAGNMSMPRGNANVTVVQNTGSRHR